MKKYISKVGLIAVIQAVMIGCTPNANTYYNRQMQPIVTKYNVLFNGEEALEKGLTELHATYQDDFSQILPVEPISMTGKVQLDGVENPNFERAEEKAIKTIQQHSMVFKGVQRNYKIDDAYILLGKARYYNERFLPALEAFNHLLTNYGQSERIPEAAVWAEKTNLRLGKTKIAIERLNNLLNINDLKRKHKAEAYATLGQAYIYNEEFSKAADALYLAGKFTKNRALRGRYYFIAAQLYENQQFKDSAVVAYEKVIRQNWKIPRKLWVEAQAGKSRNKEFSTEEKADFLVYLRKLENRYEHKDFLDVLYFTHGNLVEENSPSQAVSFYRKSLKNNKINNSLKAQTHEKLADIFFQNKNYTGAYHHLDSTLAYIPEHTFKRLYVERKKENLAKITELEYLVKKNDSILKIAAMPSEEKVAFFQKHIETLQRKKEERKDTEVIDSQFVTSFQNEVKPTDKFYFYNPMAVAYGKQQFQQQWGNRTLEDNWRWTSKENNRLTEIAEDTDNQEVTKETISPDFYIKQLPSSENEIVSLQKERNQALYQLGILYKSKFNDNELAINRLENVLVNQPEQNLEVATLYQLYKIYVDLKDEKSQVVKNQMVTKFPNSDYVNLLQGETTALQQKDAEAQRYLDSLRLDFSAGKIREVYQKLQQENFSQTAISPQIEMLNANVSARLFGIVAYREKLEKITLNYPDTPESAEAKKLLTDLQYIENEKFTSDKNAKSWKIVIEGISAENQQSLTDLVVKRVASISEKITISQDVYSLEQTWVVLHNLKDSETAKSVQETLGEFLTKNNLKAFVISSENYRLVQIKKNVEDYKKIK